MLSSHRKTDLAEIKRLREKVTKEVNEFFFEPTGFQFIDDHFGLRPGKLHVLLSTSSAGKTSLSMALLKKLLTKHTIAWFSSEESHEDIILKASKNNITDEQLTNLCFFHENELRDKTEAIENDLNPYSKNDKDFVDEFIRQLFLNCVADKWQILIIDNITTMTFWQNFSLSEYFLSSLKDMASIMKVAVFIIAHTKAGIKESSSLIETDDVRGSKSITNKAEYCYALLVFKVLEGTQTIRYPFVIVKKARQHDTSDNIYQLNWNFFEGGYTGDFKTSFDTMNEVQKIRQRLTHK